jgi:hypothetical protein
MELMKLAKARCWLLMQWLGALSRWYDGAASGGRSPIMPNGKICYVEIPATDAETSADFYAHFSEIQAQADTNVHQWQPSKQKN